MTLIGSSAPGILTRTLSICLAGALLVAGGGPARALDCGPAPADPVICLCGYGVSQRVFLIGRHELERFPPNRVITRFRVEEVFARAGEAVTVEAGDVLELSDHFAGFEAFERHETIVSDRASLAWFIDGDSERLDSVLLPDDRTLTVFGWGLDDERETAEVCTTPVPASDVATALVAADCWATLRELAPQIPPKPAYRCESPSLFCGGGPDGSAPPGWPTAAVIALVASRVLRRARAR